jgi:hypothetical protein
MDSLAGSDAFHSETILLPKAGMISDETAISSTERDGPAGDSGSLEYAANSFPMRPLSPIKYTGGNLREYLETSMEEYLDAEMEIADTLKTGLTESPPQRMVYYPISSDSPQEDADTPISFCDSTDSSPFPPIPPPLSVELDMDQASPPEDDATDEPLGSFHETIEPLSSEETIDHMIPTFEEMDLSLERKRHLESSEPTSEKSLEETTEEIPSGLGDFVETDVSTDEIRAKEIGSDLDIPRLDDTDNEVIFVGNLESPHEPVESVVPFFENDMSLVSGADVLLDEDVLNLSPTELEQLLQQIKAKVVLEDNGNTAAHSISNDGVLEHSVAPGFSDDILDILMANLPANDVGENKKHFLPHDFQKDDFPGEIIEQSIDGAGVEVLSDDPSPANQDFNADVVEKELGEAVVLEDVEIAGASEDTFIVSPEEVLDAVEEFTSVVPVPLKLASDVQDASPHELLDGAEEVILKEEDTCAFQTIPVSIPENVSLAKSDQESINGNEETTVPVSQIPVIQQVNFSTKAPEVNSPIQFHPGSVYVDRFEVFEKVWSEPNTRGDFLTTTVDVHENNIATPDNLLVSNLDRLKSPFQRDASGPLEFLHAPKGSAYIDYAKRSAHKFQKMKEELLNEGQNESTHVEYGKRSTPKLQQEEAESDVFATEKMLCTVDGRKEKKICTDAVGILIGASPLTSLEDEIVRVPTSEETKPTVKNPESVTTSCLGTSTCVIM